MLRYRHIDTTVEGIEKVDEPLFVRALERFQDRVRQLEYKNEPMYLPFTQTMIHTSSPKL